MINLDTHILIYALSGDVSAREHKVLTNNPWSISAIVLWGIAKLFQLRRITLDVDTVEFARVIAGIHVWPIDLAVSQDAKIRKSGTVPLA